MTRTVVLGFDALDFTYLDRYADSLPNFAALRERGVEAPLESTHPPWTGSAWPSMYTGTDPSHHGVYGFFEYDTYPDEGSLVTRRDVDRPALWDYLSEAGARSIVMNVPVTHPADPIEGTLVPGYLAPDDEPGHPEAIREALSAAIGEEYAIYSRGEISDDPEEKFEGYLELLDQRRRAGLELLDDEWDLAVLQVQKTDAVFHNFDDDERFRAVYEAADRFLGDVLDAVGEGTNVVVCSDHGIGPVTGYRIYVNEVLREHGFVEPADEDERPTLSSEKSSLVGVETAPEPSALERALLAGGRLADRVGVSPVDVYDAAERVGLGEALLRIAPASIGDVAGESVDWRNSRAYCPDGTRMGVRINLAGREPEGVVPPSHYDDVREELIGILSDLETPDGDPAFEFVCERERLYDGPAASRAPDVCFLPAGMNHTVSTALYGRRFIGVDDHDHKRDGVFLGAGPDVAGPAPERLSLTDVAPIAMALLGRPVPSAMTGEVPPGLLATEPTRADYGEVAYATAGGRSSDGEDDAVTERLEDLGYL
ncbi:alkaline phosphatase family protein [Salinilacihabitans rarus]|uniref:alkaline phosphatase family protein n=1 Tax=Salinilacihabitans rarus TaxID=2961596 RepID=UPI0020C8FE27|nr:alkaline phosphatase family protein [Salinilacihabitans rarus]